MSRGEGSSAMGRAGCHAHVATCPTDMALVSSTRGAAPSGVRSDAEPIPKAATVAAATTAATVPKAAISEAAPGPASRRRAPRSAGRAREALRGQLLGRGPEAPQEVPQRGRQALGDRRARPRTSHQMHNGHEIRERDLAATTCGCIKDSATLLGAGAGGAQQLPHPVRGQRVGAVGHALEEPGVLPAVPLRGHVTRDASGCRTSRAASRARRAPGSQIVDRRGLSQRRHALSQVRRQTCWQRRLLWRPNATNEVHHGHELGEARRIPATDARQPEYLRELVTTEP
mmetsp:Transcript_429/g.1222  ORF Transcript_429/g.1222 Transcript_429/m.1222 type:complete len:286 (-) Transcript_429:539-1396(-)